MTTTATIDDDHDNDDGKNDDEEKGITRMRTDGNSRFGCHEHDGEIFVDAADATTIDLTNLKTLCNETSYRRTPLYI